MREERTVAIEGQVYTVVISDDNQALLDALAEGRAVVGLWDRERQEQDISAAQYVVECPDDADEEYLEQVVRRKLGLPWIIGETKRLMIREFTMEDLPQVMREEGDQESDRIFYTPEKLREYIRCQYGFYQYGIWALIRKSDGRLIGKAGVTDAESEIYSDSTVVSTAGDRPMSLDFVGTPGLELGYHIFTPYRNLGYAVEACREILSYTTAHLTSNRPIYANIDASNEASIHTARTCGFQLIGQRYNESGQYSYLYFWNY